MRTKFCPGDSAIYVGNEWYDYRETVLILRGIHSEETAYLVSNGKESLFIYESDLEEVS